MERPKALQRQTLSIKSLISSLNWSIYVRIYSYANTHGSRPGASFETKTTLIGDGGRIKYADDLRKHQGFSVRRRGSILDNWIIGSSIFVIGIPSKAWQTKPFVTYYCIIINALTVWMHPTPIQVLQIYMNILSYDRTIQKCCPKIVHRVKKDKGSNATFQKSFFL